MLTLAIAGPLALFVIGWYVLATKELWYVESLIRNTNPEPVIARAGYRDKITQPDRKLPRPGSWHKTTLQGVAPVGGV